MDQLPIPLAQLNVADVKLSFNKKAARKVMYANFGDRRKVVVGLGEWSSGVRSANEAERRAALAQLPVVTSPFHTGRISVIEGKEVHMNDQTILLAADAATVAKCDELYEYYLQEIHRIQKDIWGDDSNRSMETLRDMIDPIVQRKDGATTIRVKVFFDTDKDTGAPQDSATVVKFQSATNLSKWDPASHKVEEIPNGRPISAVATVGGVSFVQKKGYATLRVSQVGVPFCDPAAAARNTAYFGGMDVDGGDVPAASDTETVLTFEEQQALADAEAMDVVNHF